MCNSCHSNCCCGCAFMGSVAGALNNLFSTRPYCNCSGCGCNRSREFLNGFVSGVNAANAGDHGHGCGCYRETRSNCGCGYDRETRSNTGCGCGYDRETRSNCGCNYDRETRSNTGCGCGWRGRCGSNTGCGCTRNLSSYTNCGDALNDEYYARQYGLISCPVRICNCN